MLVVILVIAFVLAYCAVNIFRCLLTKRYYRKFTNKVPNLNEYSAAVEHLFDKAGTNRRAAVSRLAGEKVSNCLTVDSLHYVIGGLFQKTIGVYKHRAINAFNPLYWLDMPIQILASFNIHAPKPLEVVFRLIFWAVTVIAAYFLERLFGESLFARIESIYRSIRG